MGSGNTIQKLSLFWSVCLSVCLPVQMFSLNNQGHKIVTVSAIEAIVRDRLGTCPKGFCCLRVLTVLEINCCLHGLFHNYNCNLKSLLLLSADALLLLQLPLLVRHTVACEQCKSVEKLSHRALGSIFGSIWVSACAPTWLVDVCIVGNAVGRGTDNARGVLPPSNR